jgi:predicted P-loop ATPase/phage/plasmid primase-like uncharacterized protein
MNVHAHESARNENLADCHAKWRAAPDEFKLLKFPKGARIGTHTAEIDRLYPVDAKLIDRSAGAEKKLCELAQDIHAGKFAGTPMSAAAKALEALMVLEETSRAAMAAIEAIVADGGFSPQAAFDAWLANDAPTDAAYQAWLAEQQAVNDLEPEAEHSAEPDAPKEAPAPRASTSKGRSTAAHNSKAPSEQDVILEFRRAIEAAGIPIKGDIVANTPKIQRAYVSGDRKGSQNCWYILKIDDGVPGGAFGCHKRYGGKKFTWSMKGAKPLTREERRELAAKAKAAVGRRAAEERELQEKAAKKAQDILSRAKPATDDHEYLKRKDVPAFGVFVGDWPKQWTDEHGEIHFTIPGALLVPMRSPESPDPVNLQAILPSDKELGRNKDFLFGARKQGCWFTIGKSDLDRRLHHAGRLVMVICEGYATAASIHRATNAVVAVAFDRTNLIHVAQYFRRKEPDAIIVIAADNDQWTAGNPGVTDATAAARAVDGVLAIPAFASVESKPTDFNDLHVREGMEPVRRQILAASRGKPELAPSVAPEPEHQAAKPTAPPPVDLRAAKGIEIMGGEHELTDAQRAALEADRAAKAKAQEDGSALHFEMKGTTILKDSQTNVRVALKKLGVTVSYDEFAKRLLYRTKGSNEHKHLDDAAVIRMWLAVDQEFKFRPAKEFFFDVVEDAARGNSFHPVKDYLNSLKWDGVERIDNWLTTYGGVEENDYTRAVGALTLLAAVRRVRRPGCKFDEMLLLITETQGKNKSTALRILASDDWFTDSFPLDADDKKVIEQTSGKWLVEAGELKGMREAESLKQLLSKQVDRARMSYGRMPIEAPRHFIVIGTSNKGKPLTDPTGNRRFWPIDVVAFDADALKRDRDQLWAEAAHREAQGASIRLPENLWTEAGRHQEAHRAVDPWDEVLGDVLGYPDHDGHLCGKIRSEDVWRIVGVPVERRDQKTNERLGAAIRRLGFERDKLRFGGAVAEHCYVRGNEEAHRDRIVVDEKGRHAEVKHLCDAKEDGDEIPF